MSWDDFFLGMCDYVAGKSKDPSTKVGAVIVRPDRTICAIGYNGFPRATNDAPHLYDVREIKYLRTVHAELNAILSAREPLHGYTLYVSPLHPCSNCTGAIIQSGISNVIARCTSDPARWGESFAQARSMFAEAGVNVVTRGPQ